MLKKKNNIPEEESLIIYKSDIKSNDLSCTYVQYEIFHPNTLEPLDLSDCSEKEISISVPANLDDDILSLYNDLDKSGYNFFDENDPFYNDICMTYTTENGTDMSIYDRKQEIEDKGKNLCQSGCKLSNYNSTNKKVKCSCDVNNKKTISRLDDISFNSVLIQNLFNELKYSNYYVLKCYKLLFNFKLLKKNIGFILMAIIFISILILFFIYIIKGRKKIEHYIKNILRNKSRYINNRKILKEKNKSNNLNNQEKKKEKKEKSEIKIKKKSEKKNKNNSTLNLKNKKYQKLVTNNNFKKNNNDSVHLIKIKKKNNVPPIKKEKKIINNNNNNNNNINQNNKESKSYGSSSSLKNYSKSKNEIKNLNINIIPIQSLHYKNKKKMMLIYINQRIKKHLMKKNKHLIKMKRKKRF